MNNFTGVLPLRAIAFQLLFLLLAIAIEGAVLRQRLGIGRKLSMQYAATVNLLSVVLGWIVFFAAEPFLPPDWRTTLVQFVFFGIRSIPPALILVGFGVFMATFVLKLQGMLWLDWLLDQLPPPPPPTERITFKGRKGHRQLAFSDGPNRPLAVLWANAMSFSAISGLLAVRLFFH
jgi:hypothetical protein